ncbi:MAG: YraN family protein [Chloroflexi bacterium]|nr:YraN family protein [Chloroflexota bacterium]
MNRRQTGQLGETLAMRYLERRGYTIVARNVRTARGELDLVAHDGGTLVFVEVRTRRTSAYGTPEESVDARKRAKLVELAEAYLQTQPSTDVPCRIDVIVVELGSANQVTRIELFQNAVE